MKSIEFKADLRKELGKKQTIALRKQEMVPCVMYGGKENIHFSAPANDFRHLIYTHHVYQVNLDVEGKKYKAILKEAQFHPVTDDLLHLDFIEVFDDKPAVVSLPVILTGNSEGIKAGGKLRQRRRYLRVKGLIQDMPDNLEIDITSLQIGDFVKVADLQFDKLELLDPAKAMIAGVSASRISKGMEEVIEAVEEGAEAGEEAKEGAEEAKEGGESSEG
jgi:large subunit ribosomal protein L25